MRNVDAVVFDVDGTLLRGRRTIPGAPETVRAVRETGASVGFVTNNPTRTPSAYVEKLTSAGIEATADEVVTSGSATAAYLAAEAPGASAFVVGEESLEAQLRDAGLSVTADPTAADGVVASIDREFDYDTLTSAISAFEAGDPWFVGTDPDLTIPTEDGFVPGSGAIVESIASVVERRPDAVLGKPHEFTIEHVFERLGAEPARTLVVGDRLNTDVAFGERAGATTVLVETGVASAADVASSDVDPDHVLASVETVTDLL